MGTSLQQPQTRGLFTLVLNMMELLLLVLSTHVAVFFACHWWIVQKLVYALVVPI